jgi:hypothetical protein
VESAKSCVSDPAGGVVEEVGRKGGSGSDIELEGCSGVSLGGSVSKVGAGSGGREERGGCESAGAEAGLGRDDGSDNLGEGASGFPTSTGDGEVSPTPSPWPPSSPFTSGTDAAFAMLGDSEWEPTDGEGVVLSKF